MKKFTIAILSLILVLSSMAFIGCGGGDDGAGVGHEHSYEKLKYDAQNHWYECSCAEKSGVEAHKGGTATETKKAVCEVCNQEYGDVLAPGHTHTFNKQVVADKFKKSSATCKGKAVYYLSCECGEKGSQTFESGAIGTHNYVGGVCEYCNNPEGEAQIGPMTKTQWQTALSTVITNGTLSVGPINSDKAPEYNIFEYTGNLIHKFVYEYGNLVENEEIYCQIDGANYITYQKNPLTGDWLSTDLKDQIQDIMLVQAMINYSRGFIDYYNSFSYNETSGCYVATNLEIGQEKFEYINIYFENGNLKQMKFSNGSISLETSKIGSTIITLPENVK